MAHPHQFDVFLSHSSVDKPWIVALKNELQKRGIKVWLDRDEIRPGDLFVNALEQGLNASRTMVLGVSPESMASGWVREEYARALSLAQATDSPLRLIPVILRCAELPGFLNSRSWVDFRNQAAFQESVDRLVWGITGAKTLGEQSKCGTESSEIETNATLPLQIVALSVQQRLPFPLLDIRLLNRSADPVVIHELSIVVLSSRTYFREISTSPNLVSSHVYHLLLDPVRPASVSKEMSFVVNPKSADRFHVVVGTTAGGYFSGREVLLVNVEDGLRKHLETITDDALDALHYNPKAVEIEGKLRLVCNGTLVVESPSFKLRVEVDHHFHPSKEQAVVDTSGFLKQVAGISEQHSEEAVHILGRLKLETQQQREAENLLNKKLRLAHIPTLVESASALARLGNPDGINWLINAVGNRGSDIWLRIFAVRSLIRLTHFERRIYVDIMKGDSVPLKLEVLRVIGFMRESSVFSELEELVAKIDDVVQYSFNVHAFEGAGGRARMLDRLLDARRNRELEEIIRAIGAIRKPEGVDVIRPILEDERTYSELSYELLIACIEALGQIGGTTATAELIELENKLPNLFGPSQHVSTAIRVAKQGGDVEAQVSLALGRSPRIVPADLVTEREHDDFENLFVKLDKQPVENSLNQLIGKQAQPQFWFRGPNQELIAQFRKLHPETELVSIHFHNTPPHLYIAGEWRKHPKLQGRFHPEYPDDVQVIVHDGGPRVTDRRPEGVWVTVTDCTGDVFKGRVLNQPNHLKTVKQDDIILFIVPERGEFPIQVTPKYLEERKSWTVLPCKRCGLSELFDAPSDLLRIVFPETALSSTLETFTAFCGACGGIQVVVRKGSSLEKSFQKESPKQSA